VAKSVTEAVRHRAAQAGQSSVTRTSTVGRGVLGFKKTYSQTDLDRIETQRREMRERLLAEG
jgi:hypothetical protein